jgi:hypothetical protein
MLVDYSLHFSGLLELSSLSKLIALPDTSLIFGAGTAHDTGALFGTGLDHTGRQPGVSLICQSFGKQCWGMLDKPKLIDEELNDSVMLDVDGIKRCQLR